MLQQFPRYFIDEEIKQLKRDSKPDKRIIDFLWKWKSCYAFPEDLENIERVLMDALKSLHPKKFASVDLYIVTQQHGHTSEGKKLYI